MPDVGTAADSGVQVGVAAVAALAVIATPWCLNLNPKRPEVAVPASTSSPSVAPSPTTTPCASPNDLTPGTTLTDGAVVSGYVARTSRWGGRSGPAEALTTGVSAAIKAYNDLPKADPNQVCTMEYRLNFTVVAEHANGKIEPVVGGLHGAATPSATGQGRQLLRAA